MATEQLLHALINLASAVKTERKARNEKWAACIQADWRDAVEDRIETLALIALHDVTPSHYPDERHQQVVACALAPLFVAGGTY